MFAPIRGLAHSLAGYKVLRPDRPIDWQACWMGIGLSERTYPDDRVIQFLRWAHKRSSEIRLVIADEPRVFNELAQKKVCPHLDQFLNSERYAGAESQAEFLAVVGPRVLRLRERGQRRKDTLQELAVREGLTSVTVSTWDETYEMVHHKARAAEYCGLLLDKDYYPGSLLDRSIAEVSRQVIPEIFGTHYEAFAQGHDDSNRRMLAQSYAFEEVRLTVLMTVAGYPTKFGPPIERAYDQATLDFFSRQPSADSKMKGIKFQGVYVAM